MATEPEQPEGETLQGLTRFDSLITDLCDEIHRIERTIQPLLAETPPTTKDTNELIKEQITPLGSRVQTIGDRLVNANAQLRAITERVNL